MPPYATTQGRPNHASRPSGAVAQVIEAAELPVASPWMAEATRSSTPKPVRCRRPGLIRWLSETCDLAVADTRHQHSITLATGKPLVSQQCRREGGSYRTLG